MATRRPLYYDNGNFREMSDTQINEIIAQVSYQYSLSPAVALSVSASNISGIGSINDTRLIAGTTSTSTTSFPNPPDTTTKTIAWNRVGVNKQLPGAVSLPTGFSYPVYWTGTGIQPMSATDFKDTFIYPAINNLSTGSTGTAQGGTYRIHTATSLAGHTLVSSNLVYQDTRANAALYDTTDETLDQPTTITNYYLFKINGSDTSYTAPLSLRSSDNNLQTFSDANFETLLQDHVVYSTINDTGYRLNYSIGATGSGNTRGSGMTDTKLNSQVTRTKFVNANDYRAQDVPAGTATTQATYYLRINQS